MSMSSVPKVNISVNEGFVLCARHCVEPVQISMHGPSSDKGILFFDPTP